MRRDLFGSVLGPRNRWGACAALAVLPLLVYPVGCGGEEFTEAPMTGGSGGGNLDAQSDSPPDQASGGTGGEGGADDAAGGTGGVAGNGGSGGNWDGGGAGSGGSVTDASVDQGAPDAALPCDPGFGTEPEPPTSPAFTLSYQSSVPYTCVGFKVACSNGDATLGPMELYSHGSGGCPTGATCWKVEVSGCKSGLATAEFIEDKCLPTETGVFVASCKFVVE